MASPTTDRRLGLVGNTALKAPCDLATTANITLSGEQSIDGTTTSSSRVFVKNQTTTANNGIYDTSSGSWTRARDFDGAYDIVTGTIITVTGGTTNSHTAWLVTNTGTITIGTTGLTFASAAFSDASSVGFLQAGTGAVARTGQSKMRDWVSVQDFGAVGNGTTDDAAAFTLAIAASKGVVFAPRGTYKFGSQVVVTDRVKLLGEGYSQINGTGAGNRGATCFLRAFTGTSATIALNGDDTGMDLIDVDSNSQGTGDGVQVWGGRVKLGAISSRNSGGDGIRIGRTNAGASSTNTNFWTAGFLIVCGNAGAGVRVDDTNTTTSASYPLGLANANAGYCGLIDARSNGTDGLQIGNANDNVFSMVGSQSNTGCGIRFKTDGTNSGPRCNKILGNDCESNTGNDIQIDAATLPAAGPGLYNVVLGNRSVSVSPRIVDNSTGSYVFIWDMNPGTPGFYHSGKALRAVSPLAAGAATVDLYADTSYSNVASMKGTQSVGSGGKWTLQTKRNGNTPVDRLTVNEVGLLQHLYASARLQSAVTYSASMTIDATVGDSFIITATNGTAFTINAPTTPITGQRISVKLKNSSGGALGVATWNAVFKMAALTNPADGFSRTIDFEYDGTNWVQISQTGVDVPN
jgi:uncharacterized cupin superfamily protein